MNTKFIFCNSTLDPNLLLKYFDADSLQNDLFIFNQNMNNIGIINSNIIQNYIELDITLYNISNYIDEYPNSYIYFIHDSNNNYLINICIDKIITSNKIKFIYTYSYDYEKIYNLNNHYYNSDYTTKDCIGKSKYTNNNNIEIFAFYSK